MYASYYGNKNAFEPIWYLPTSFNYFSFFKDDAQISLHLYDISPLKETLHKFMDFEKINYYFNQNIVLLQRIQKRTLKG
jgi:hypothetical protein